MHTNIRQPVVAGSFYSAEASQLDQEINDFLGDSEIKVYQQQPLALIVPHAGYIYSAPIAASGYKQLQAYADQINRVVLLGPSHRIPFMGIASTAKSFFATPLGDVPVDRIATDKVNQLDFVYEFDEAHAYEHSLEVQLPFLQKSLKQFSLLPLVIGQASNKQVSQVIDLLWDEHHTLFLISSDLSHYLSYNAARQCDQATCLAIEQLHPEKIEYEQACGRIGISGMLLAARKHHLKVKTLNLRNSGDTAGPRDQVVGYGSWAFYKDEK